MKESAVSSKGTRIKDDGPPEETAMRFRIPALFAVIGLLGLGSFQEVSAQPISPVRSPGFTPFMGVMGRGGGSVGGYYGMFRPQVQLQQLQAEMLQNYSNLANQQAIVSNMVASGLPQTGRGAVYNNLGHWYPSSRFGSAGGGGMLGSRYGMVNQTSLLPPGIAGTTGVAVGFGGIRR